MDSNERRSKESRRKIANRRSGVDTRPVSERVEEGERRSHEERRILDNRRSNSEVPAEQ